VSTFGKFRLASVSYLNAKPLIWGLERDHAIELQLAVPSRLLGLLETGAADVALLPVADLLNRPKLRIIPAGAIGCDGKTLTVRVFSHVPIGQVRSMLCDPDSHTSVALARVILAERYGATPELKSASDLPGSTQNPASEMSITGDSGRPVSGSLRSASEEIQAILLIGDKVICEPPAGYAYEIDLGEEWKNHTGLPFVFAAWTVRPGAAVDGLGEILEATKRAGRNHIDDIIAKYAVPRGWPADVARRYLTEHLKYDIGPREMEAISLFHHKCRGLGM